MEKYHAYGLCLASELDLPELRAANPEQSADIEIRFGEAPGPMPVCEPRLVQFDLAGAYLAWPTIGRFRAAPDGQITVSPLTNNSQAIRFALLGPVLAAVLQQRGVPLLHGSAVAIGSRAVAFVGPKRAGKSTAAAAMVAAGCHMLNDDVLPLRSDRFDIMLEAGFPALKLEPEVHSLILPSFPIVGNPSDGPGDKVLVADRACRSGQFPIAAIVVLGPGAVREPVTLSPDEAFRQILQNGYALQFGKDGVSHPQQALLFASSVALARKCLVVRLGTAGGESDTLDLARRLTSLLRSLEAAIADSSGQTVPSTPLTALQSSRINQ